MDSIPWKHILGDKLAGGEGTRVELHPIVEAALVAIETHGLDTQGLFRVPGSASQVKALKEVYKTKKKVPDLSETDSNTVCSLLTDHLRSEEPLLTYALAPRWVQSSGLPDLVVRLTKYVDLINQLPVANHATLFAILRLLVLISQHAEKTLMPATNLGTIFGPMICRRLNADIAQELGDIPAVSKLCIDLITHFSQLFDYYDLDAPPGGGAVGGVHDGLATDSPRTKKTTRRKFQFGKEKPYQGDRQAGTSPASGNTWSPAPGSSSTSPTPNSPSALSALASVTTPGSPVVPLQSPPVPAPEYEPPSAVELDDALCPGPDGECGQDHNGRARKNAMYSKQPDQHRHNSESGEGAQPRSPKAQGGLASVSLELDEDRASGGSKVDGKSVMRSLSLMGGFYSKTVSKTLPGGGADLETSHSSADVEDLDDEGKDADKKDKKRLPALNIKKRKNSMDKKKLRMFSPRKLFDKDRGAKSSPDSDVNLWSTGTSDPSELKYYDGSSSSEREEHLAGKQESKFGGRKIPFRSAQRKSSSWPEAELLELRQAADSAREDESDDNSSYDEDGADSESSTQTSSARMHGDRDHKGATQHRMRSDTGESRSMEIEVVKAQNRKGSQSERGPSASARAAARGGKPLAGSSLTADNLELQIRKEREAMASSPRGNGGNDDERGLRGMWVASSPRNPAMTNILVLKSPRIVGEAAALDDALRSQETIVGHLAPEEELGMVKWKKRMTVGSARRREAATATSAVEGVQTAVKGDGAKDDDDSEEKENDENQQTGVAFLLSKYYVDGHSNGVSASTSTSTSAGAGARTRPRERPTVRLESEKQQTTDREKVRESGNESDGDTENEDDVDDDGGTTTEDEGSGGSNNASSGDEKGKRTRENDKPRRRTSSRKLSGKKATAKDSSGLKLGRKVKRGEEEASEDEDDQLAPPLTSPTTARIHSPRPRPSEDHIGSSNNNNGIISSGSGSSSSITRITID